jgi:glycosyltransferase involved in cell wall biosynthesis
MMKKVAIVGSHGLYASYGGWDQLVNNLAEKKLNNDFEYLIFNSSQSLKNFTTPPGVKIRRIEIKSSGFIGLFFDFYSILLCYFKVDVILFLGVQGMPLVTLLSLFRKRVIVSNMGGIEWERPKFSFFAKIYLKFCFWLGLVYSKWVILDNEYYKIFVPKKYTHKAQVIPYGGEIDFSMTTGEEVINKYSFIKDEYFLSISRSLKDNQIEEICKAFVGITNKLVLISNFSKSDYGKYVFENYKDVPNIVLIDGLYNKSELDLIRRNCLAYIHTHTLCGTAPSLVEMIICRKPIISFDIPQNRFTLDGQGAYFNNFVELTRIVTKVNDFNRFVPNEELCKRYNWEMIVYQYEKTYS